VTSVERSRQFVAAAVHYSISPRIAIVPDLTEWRAAARVTMSELPVELIEAAAAALKRSAEAENVYVSLKRARLMVRPTLEAVLPMIAAQPARVELPLG
jgi:hypothetical protein